MIDRARDVAFDGDNVTCLALLTNEGTLIVGVCLSICLSGYLPMLGLEFFYSSDLWDWDWDWLYWVYDKRTDGMGWGRVSLSLSLFLMCLCMYVCLRRGGIRGLVRYMSNLVEKLDALT